MKIALYQMHVIPGKPEENMKKISEWFNSLDEEIDLVVLPEMWNTSYRLSDLNELADEDGQVIIPFLQEEAKRMNKHIVGGSIAYKTGNDIYNRAIIINNKGVLINTYDKAHLVPMLNEHHYLTSGEKKPRIFNIDDIEMGTIICYDLRFPELARSLALEDAKVIFVTAQWPASRIDHWQSLLKARAIENQVFIVACNTVGTCDNNEFGGHTLVYAPDGTLINSLYEDEGTLTVELDFETQEQIRESIPIFNSLRTDLY
ncbi:carbon-nitrogen family hydrolase [Mammaliicoccus stepanovicii]|uniref:Aliphatic amidase amiE n=1 Tax=Mammaliicoccus stepanovicii TaxID=643214 RepID=A0A239YTQ3_9STAP|nr:carbon-nitrogen family hydrolase [Mammaliicoccus stepanovicii]PNZ75879.1 carbon-nitrogen family hydrolase [Mammaliicoccus stepanovicii]GGI42373.1 hydrolase in agr operon [Mammaliicoccus stepanovicii]SNV61614.1 Aliphatic amidase amiE [Mammaliicoccus stepanovicii]